MKEPTKEERARFSIIELLCLIVIVGLILFMTLNHYLKVRVDDTVSLEAIITKAAEVYYQEHPDRLPKNIGESQNINLKDLRDLHYLKQDIYSLYDESCMPYSYVRTYRLTENECTYHVYLYCGDEIPPESEVVPSPTIKLSFSDEDGEEISNKDFNQVENASFLIDINGGETRGGTLLAIDHYSFTISVLTNSDTEQAKVYHSGVLYTNRYEHLKFMKKISDYMKMEDATSISISVKVQNVVGGFQEVSLSSSLEP